MTPRFLRISVAAAALAMATVATPAFGQVGDRAFNVAPEVEGIQLDVKEGRLTPEQARELETDLNQWQVTFQAKVDGVTKRLTVSLQGQGVNIDAISGDLKNALTALKENPNGDLGGITDGVVDGLVAFHQVKATFNRELGPLLNDMFGELNALVQKRAEFIASNPNVSKEQKRQVAAEARKANQALTTVLPRLMAESSTKIEETNDKLQNGRIEMKDKVRDEVAKRIAEKEKLYGTDRSKWPKDAPPPAKPAQPAVAQNPPQPKPPITSPFAPIGRRDPVTPPSSKPGTGKPSGRPGTIPSSSRDPAFSVDREVTVQTDKPTTTPSPKGNATQSKPKTNATVAANDPAFNASRNRPTDAPKPPPPPQANPLDDLKPIRTIDPMPSAGQKGRKKPDPLETRTSPGTTGIGSGQSPNPGDAGIPGKPRPTTKPPANGSPTAVAGALAGAGAAAADPLKDLKLPPLGRAGRGDGGDAGDSGTDAGGGGDRLTDAERSGAAQGNFSPADAFNAAGRFLTSVQDRGIMQVAVLADIYAGYDPDRAPGGRSGRSLTAAPNSLPLDWHLPSINDALQPAYPGGLLVQGQNVQSYANNWRSLNLWGDPLPDRSNEGINSGRVTEILPGRSLFDYSNFPGYSPFFQQPLSEVAPGLVAGLYGLNVPDRYLIQRDPRGVSGRISSGARYVGSLYDDDARYLRLLATNDIGGLDRLLAQPFNVLLTWGAGAFDLDLHLTGPTGEGQSDRFHIFFAARGNLNAFPFAELIRDCICNSGSEVILTTQLIRGGIYRISAFNFGNQSGSSTNLADQSGAVLQIVRGGRAVSVGNGTTIQGGRVIYTGRPPAGQPGNTWVAVEINPTTGRIFNPNTITQSPNSEGVR